MESVIAKLAGQFGISVRPGQKLECPFCHHHTFQVKADDSLGKCFHPSCGKFIRAGGSAATAPAQFGHVLDEIFETFHAELMSLKSQNGLNAYRYLTEERQIHPQVVADSMLGVVPPYFQVDSLLLNLLMKPNESGKSEMEHQDFLEIQAKLRDCIPGCSRWLCFFYTDQFHRITSIKFRKPYDKEFRYFKPFQNAGLFGHSLFSVDGEWGPEDLEGRLIVCEGEMNQLQLQSLSLRYSESQSKPLRYLAACAIGGINNADLETLTRICRCPVICYDNDISGAGFKLVEKMQKVVSLEAFTTPEPDSDLDDFIRSFGSDQDGAWNSLKELICQRKFCGRSFAPIAERIFEVRKSHGRGDRRREHEIFAHVANLILEDLYDRGRLYNDGFEGYFFEFEFKELIKIDCDKNNFVLLISKYGINKTERIFRYITEQLFVSALDRGEQAKIYRFSHFDLETHTLYLHNHGNQIFRIKRDTIDLVDNGTDGSLGSGITSNLFPKNNIPIFRAVIDLPDPFSPTRARIGLVGMMSIKNSE